MSRKLGKTAVVIGASSGVGRALATELAREGLDLILVARDAADLEAVAADCGLRFGVNASAKTLDLAEDLDADAFGDWVESEAECVPYFFAIAGANATGDAGAPDDRVIRQMTLVNFQVPAQLMSLAARRAEKWKLRTIVACSSIAAAVPRKRNMAYAAAKSALETFALGLRHELAAKGVLVQVYRLGYVDTNLSFGQKLLFPVAAPECVARRFVAGIASDFGVRYLPRYWGGIVTILRCLPWSMYKRLKF
jgi:short-subunit dehydrogenase